MGITIREKDSGTILAQSEEGAGVVSYEKNWYFDPSAVSQDVLKVTTRTYTCPYKGLCHWVDYVAPDGQKIRDVSWVYPNPNPGHEAIKGRYGFYAGAHGATRQE
jgi:uncharacterized protein (DUF427 family)